MTIKAVLFDLDGTILNRHKSLVRFVKRQFSELAFDAGNVTEQRYVKRFIKLDQRGYIWKDKVYQQLVKEFQIRNFSWEELLDKYISGFSFHAVTFPHVVDTLQSLKDFGYALGIITNGRTQFQLSNIKALGIHHLFDVILVSEAEGIKKPDKQIFLRALHKLELKPHEAVYVGDHPFNDVEASRKLGMKGIWKEDTFFGKIDEHDGVFRNWSDLIDIVNRDIK